MPRSGTHHLQLLFWRKLSHLTHLTVRETGKWSPAMCPRQILLKWKEEGSSAMSLNFSFLSNNQLHLWELVLCLHTSRRKSLGFLNCDKLCHNSKISLGKLSDSIWNYGLILRQNETYHKDVKSKIYIFVVLNSSHFLILL